MRPAGSVELDEHRTRGGFTPPPFVRWDHFLAGWEWEQGEHITTIGPTGSGKTVLNRQLLRRRDLVIVLGVKQRDPELYGPFQREGYELVRTFDPEDVPEDEPMRVLFVPRVQAETVQEEWKKQGAAFRRVLNDIRKIGFWTVYADDIQFQADKLNLANEFEALWMIGRSELISVVASSQEPVNIPVMAYGAATHLFLFKNNDLYRARRMAELAGVNREVAQETIIRLPEHEFLYVNRNTGQMLRSKVTRRR